MWKVTSLKRHTNYVPGEVEFTMINNDGELTSVRVVVPIVVPDGYEPGMISNIDLSVLLFDLSYGLEPGIVDEYLENDKYDPAGPGPPKANIEIPGKPIIKKRGIDHVENN